MGLHYGIDFRTGSHGQTVLHHMKGAFVLHGQTVTTPHSVVAPAQVSDDTQARIERIE